MPRRRACVRGIEALTRASFVTALLYTPTPHPASVRVRLRSAGPAVVRRRRIVPAPASAPGAQQGSRRNHRARHPEGERLQCVPGSRGLHPDPHPALAQHQTAWQVRPFFFVHAASITLCTLLHLAACQNSINSTMLLLSPMNNLPRFTLHWDFNRFGWV